jgi:hypothetical protein
MRPRRREPTENDGLLHEVNVSASRAYWLRQAAKHKPPADMGLGRFE